jgi:hypothetical protein
MSEKVEKVKVEEEKPITFFSETDISKGRISSEYPAWYFRNAVEDLREDIRREEFNLDSGIVPDSSRPQVIERIHRLRDRLDKIEESFPTLSSAQESKLIKVKNALAKEISSLQFTRSQMVKGLADGHEEARRMITPSISVTPEMAEVAQACNVQPINGKISRNQAEKIFKIAARYFGEMSNTEALRKD